MLQIPSCWTLWPQEHLSGQIWPHHLFPQQMSSSWHPLRLMTVLHQAILVGCTATVLQREGSLCL